MPSFWCRSVDSQVKDSFHVENSLIAPLAITIFSLVLLMNAVDLAPVDAVHFGEKVSGLEFFKAVPTTDLNVTLGMIAFSVSIGAVLQREGEGRTRLCQRIPVSSLQYDLAVLVQHHPQTIEELAKPISLGLRLFGNMYAGELYSF